MKADNNKPRGFSSLSDAMRELQQRQARAAPFAEVTEKSEAKETQCESLKKAEAALASHASGERQITQLRELNFGLAPLLRC